MQRKKLTAEHVTYIFNKVIIPQIDFIMQIFFFTKMECSKVMAPIHKLLKHKCGLARSINNNILHMHCPFGLIDLFTHQQQLQADFLTLQLSDPGILGRLSFIQLLQLQYKYWTPYDPFSAIRRNTSSKQNKCLMENIIYGLKDLPLRIQYASSLNINIKGGQFTLTDILPIIIYRKSIKRLIQLKLLFLDQLVSAEGKFLLDWHALKLFYGFKGQPPKWLQALTPLVLANNTYMLDNKYTNIKNDILIHNDYKFCVDINNNNKKEWIAFWHREHSQIIIGKIGIKEPQSNLIWKHHHTIQCTIDNQTLPPLQQSLIVFACPGCNLDNNQYIAIDYRIVTTLTPASSYERNIRLSPHICYL